MNYEYNNDFSVTFKVNSELPERAWSNILANDTFGFIASDAGTGHMWHLNSRENRINRWLNDPLTLKGTERLEWQRGNECISLFADDDGYDCSVTYGFGYARWDKNIADYRFSVIAFVPMDKAARVMAIETNCDEGEIRYYTDLVLGNGETHGEFIVTEFKNGMFSAQNKMNREYPADIFRLTVSSPQVNFTCNRLSWQEKHLDGVTGAGFLPCIGITMDIAGLTVISCGCEDAEVIKELCGFDNFKKELLKVLEWWKNAVSPVQIKTPDADLDSYISGWALYQVIACRLKARCSIYQCGGAYGFRDQLQDALAVIASDPLTARKLILSAAAHQFEEGDVQHWWHPAENGEIADKGIRTRCSDDMLWLPYVLCEYVKRTDDIALCCELTGYIKTETLKNSEMERYCYPEKSMNVEPVIDHALRAAKLVIERGTGKHGLCYFGSGDWNDGMNMVGKAGEGESVWLTWFAALVFNKLAELCDKLGKGNEAERLSAYAEEYRKNADKAWDGEWFLRGWYDNGKPLGSNESSECQIDSVAQSFSVFAGGDLMKSKIALASAYKRLVDRDNRIIRLFDPPFDDGPDNPGYIKGYIPGIRENGGQYTHAAVWLAKAFLELGDSERGYELLKLLLPSTHNIKVYKAEPFVLAGDVYSNDEIMGLAGWSWYTGAAGWFYQTAVESMLGLRVRNGRLFIEPNIPDSWEGYKAVWVNGDEQLKIVIKSDEITVNGKEYDTTGYVLKIYNNFISENGKM